MLDKLGWQVILSIYQSQGRKWLKEIQQEPTLFQLMSSECVNAVYRENINAQKCFANWVVWNLFEETETCIS